MYLNFYTSKSKRKLQDTHVPMLFFVFSNDLFFLGNLFSVFPCENEELLFFFEVIILKSSQQKARQKVVGFLQPSPAKTRGIFRRFSPWGDPMDVILAAHGDGLLASDLRCGN